jgi:16S rRNA (uracil1498-N3)-methyltransferase
MTVPRLYLARHLGGGADIALDRDQGRYLAAVLRLKPGDPVKVFNGEDGEWLAYLTEVSKKRVALRCERRVADASLPPDLDLLFAPLKHARLDYMVQKAVELGVRRLRPVLTKRTAVLRVNLNRMRANAIEAAEQCNLVAVPEVLEPAKIETVFEDWDGARALIHCDETGAVADPLQALRAVKLPAAVLIGPEGGFEDGERDLIARNPHALAISLGPRIMRADTAAVAALALVQAAIGDWRLPMRARPPMSSSA